MIKQPFKARTTEELMALLGAVATAILACIIVATLYFGREIFVPIALAILLSFVLAPLVGLLQHLRVPRGVAVVSVVVAAFALIFAMGSLLATQLTQLAGDLPRYQSTISEKIQSIRETTAGRGTLERASGMLKDLGKELDKPTDTGSKPGSGSISIRCGRWWRTASSPFPLGYEHCGRCMLVMLRRTMPSTGSRNRIRICGRRHCDCHVIIPSSLACWS